MYGDDNRIMYILFFTQQESMSNRYFFVCVYVYKTGSCL